MMMAQEAELLKAERAFEETMAMIRQASQEGRTIEKVEGELWKRSQAVNRALLNAFVLGQGTGDLGPTIERQGRPLQRLEETYERRYVSVFGELMIERTVYGSRPTQKHEIVPLDAMLGLPDSEASYLLQDWCQSFCIKGSHASACETIERMLGIRFSVRTLEHMNRQMGASVEGFQRSRQAPPREEEGAILVVAADGKGVPMRRDASERPTGDRKRRSKGEKANKKREACVGAVYTIEPFVRTPEEIVDDVFRRQRSVERPAPCHKRLWAELTRPTEGEEIKGKERTFRWLEQEVAQRRARGQPLVFVSDGDRALREMRRERLPEAECILDIFHATERLWQAAHCFHPEGSQEASDFVEQRLLRVLEGDVGRVIGGFKQMATKHELRGSRRTQLRKAVRYLEKNRQYMKYDEYLAAGYPIGSGVVEGACRHLVKDRMEGTGMRWLVSGAQPMLHLRAVWLNDDWDAFQIHRQKAEARRLYPYRRLVQQRRKAAA
jgi:hypothetical protein